MNRLVFNKACRLNVAIKTASSDFVIFEIGKNNQRLLYPKISKDNFEFSNNRNICERTIVDEYEYNILSRNVEKQLSFTVLNALKGHFCVIYKDFSMFSIFKFCLIWALRSVLVPFLHSWWKSDSAACITPPEPKIFILTF